MSSRGGLDDSLRDIDTRDTIGAGQKEPDQSVARDLVEEVGLEEVITAIWQPAIEKALVDGVAVGAEETVARPGIPVCIARVPDQMVVPVGTGAGLRRGCHAAQAR